MDFSTWEEHETYYISQAPQGSETWFNLRKGLLTASKVAGAGGKDYFNPPEKVARHMLGYPDSPVPERNRAFMKHGIEFEPKIRQWYSKKFNVEVREVGLAVPKWDTRIGGSLDGRTDQKSIEIKAPQKMYPKLQSYIDNPFAFDVNDHSYIYDSHYIQMQTNMAITNDTETDYVVYCDKKINIITVPFNQAYWDDELYPAINKFFQTMPQYIELWANTYK